MIYKDLYDKISNPLDDMETVDRVLEAYADSYDFYMGLTHTNTPKESGSYFISERDNFALRLFEDWRNNLLTIYYEDRFNPELREKAKKCINYLFSLEPKSINKRLDRKSVV